MRFVLLCLSFVRFSHLWGNPMSLEGNYSLECLNDYLFTITCVLNVSSNLLPHGATSWLEFNDYREPYQCVLKVQAHSWVCELDLTPLVEYTFTDTDFFQISLNSSYHGNSSSAVLEVLYRPVKHIRPVPPSNLSYLGKTDRVVFHWLSGYQENTSFVQNLQYELSIHGDGKVTDVHPVDTHVVVDMSIFVPHRSYMARVRSVPNQMHYRGVWSHWGPAVHWTTGANSKGETPGSSFSSIWFAVFCLLPVLFLLLSYIPYYRWKKQVLIPSPTPYIRDFKRCAVPLRIVGELLQGEESLKIDSMIEESDSTPSPNPVHYEKMRSVHDQSEQPFITSAAPFTSPSMIRSPAGAEISFSSWLEDCAATDTGSVTCSEDYCTLSHINTEQANK
ncbi:interleukin-21 receptor [Pygocentrus nattereri]|uniref:Fibronectin type-III domain-containing protein n=1 Tax=Pygocentrus nattereri TaxID=42514 RepID=A0AAR2IJ83_PYGNA|nr:interleukin-21 receptor [Pygocentrus nattereri]